MAASSSSEDQITKRLQELRSQLDRKRTFESAISGIKSFLLESYSSSSPSTRNLFYDVVCRVATVLRTRYTAPGYLLAGADLLEAAEQLVGDPSQKAHLRSRISNIRSNLNLGEEDEPGERQNSSRGGYLFEGHVTVDPEPPQPNWLVQQNLLTALASQSQAHDSSGEDDVNNSAESMGTLLRGLVESLEDSMMEGLEDFLPAEQAGRSAALPASKEVVAKLPVIKVDEGVLKKVGEDAECCICKEKLGLGHEMQELPCKHLFHPPCLKPWLEEHNSCPICRHELPTDDHKYESWKEREKELEEERRGAANALPGGEFMYV